MAKAKNMGDIAAAIGTKAGGLNLSADAPDIDDLEEGDVEEIEIGEMIGSKDPEPGVLTGASAAAAEPPVPKKTETDRSMWTFCARYNCTKGLRSSKKRMVKNSDGSYSAVYDEYGHKVPMIFTNRTFFLTRQYAESLGLPTDPSMDAVAEFIILAKRFPGYGQDFFLCAGPGVESTETTESWLNFAAYYGQKDKTDRAPTIVSGSR